MIESIRRYYITFLILKRMWKYFNRLHILFFKYKEYWGVPIELNSIMTPYNHPIRYYCFLVHSIYGNEAKTLIRKIQRLKYIVF